MNTNVFLKFVQHLEIKDMEILDLILSVLGSGILIIKSYIFMPALIVNAIDDPDYIKSQIERTLKEYPNVKHKMEVHNFVTSVYDDKFSMGSVIRKFRLQNLLLLTELEILKCDILNFYFATLPQVNEIEPQTNHACDVHNTVNNKILQLKRLRMVIDPEIQISQNIHPVSKIAYIAVKSFWIDDNGIKSRDFTKSLGPLEDYGFKEYDKEKVSKDPKVIEESLKRIQEVIYTRYKEYYPE